MLVARLNGASPTFSGPVTYNVGTQPRAVAVGDFNVDGKPDLAVANSNSTVSTLLGNGDGTFATAVTFDAGNGLNSSLAVADVNLDGKPDLAVTAYYSSSVRILLGNGNGTFATAVNYAVGGAPRSVAVGDVNGDGKPDLAVANESTNVSILLGNGNGTFQSAVNYSAGANPWSVALGDVNSDGTLDLAIANYYPSSSASILLGNGDGTFQSAVNYPAGTNPYSVALGDVNSDGMPDLAVANYGSFFDAGLITFRLGNGDGTFGAAVNYAASNPTSVTIGDVTGDGRPELVAASSGFNGSAPRGVSIVPPNGDGTFGATLTYAAGSGPFAVALGEFNGDGKPDLAVADYDNHKAVILLNTSADWPFTFTDDALTSRVTPAKTVHVAELRDAINALRARHGLGDVSFADSPLTPRTTQIRATHIIQLRAALDAVYDALGRPRPTYTDPTMTAGVTTLKTVHLTQIRAAVRAAGWFVLTAGRSGSGAGTVAGTPPGITCGTDCAETYLPGRLVTLTATAAAGSTFAGWSGGCTGTGACSVTMAADTSVTATFDIHPFTLAVTKSGTGTGTVTSSPSGINCGSDCQEGYAPGTSVTLTPAPSAGSYFANWTGACSGNGACTVTMNSDSTVGAVFNGFATYDVQPVDYNMGVGGGCPGGVLGVVFRLNAPADSTWEVTWSGSDFTPVSNWPTGSLDRSSGAGSGDVTFTVTAPAQSAHPPLTCSDWTDYPRTDNFVFRFKDSGGQEVKIIYPVARWTYRRVN